MTKIIPASEEKNIFLVLIFFVFLSLRSYGQAPANDTYAGAINVGPSGTINLLPGPAAGGTNCAGSTSSTIAGFTTVNATADTPPGNPAYPANWCCSGTYGSNVWFYFVASTSYISAVINTTAMTSAYVGIWDATNAVWLNNSTSLSPCVYIPKPFTGDAAPSITNNGLTPGNTYYICVDVRSGYTTGAFQLCLTDVIGGGNISGAANNDFWQAAYTGGSYDVTGLINTTCTNNNAYNNFCATPDGAAPPASTICFSSTGANNDNVWFSFVATSTGFIEIDVTSNNQSNSLSAPAIAVCTTPTLATSYFNCQTASSGGSGNKNCTVTFTAEGLIQGTTYYISVSSWQNAQGVFSLCLKDVSPLSFDYKQNALDISGLINICSSSHEYTNVGATAGSAGETAAISAASCYHYAGTHDNVWFKFKATSTGMMRIDVETDGTSTGLGTLYRGGFALCTDTTGNGVYTTCTGTSESAASVGGDAYQVFTGLTPNQYYWITVFGIAAVNDGSFTICLTDHDNDFYQTPTQITNLNNSCYSGGISENLSGATADGPATVSCWGNSGNAPSTNRWFMFQAIGPSLTMTLTAVAGIRFEMALYNTGISTSLPPTSTYTPTAGQLTNCVNMGFNTPITITNTVMVVGNWYYVEVDSWAAATTFSLCINNDGPTYYSLNSGNWNSNNNWSFQPFSAGSRPATASGQIPGSNNVVYVSNGNIISVSDAEQCAGLNLDVSATYTGAIGVTVDGSAGGSLKVNGNVAMTNTTSAGFDGNITIQNSGTLTVTDAVNYTATGGNGAMALTVGANGIGDNSVMTVGLDIVYAISGGTTSNNLYLYGGSKLSIAHDLTLTYTSGNPINVSTNNTSTLTVTHDINFSTASSGKELISLNGTSFLQLGRQFTQSTSGLGQLTSATGATLEFNGSATSGYLLGTGGTESWTLYNLKINNTFSSAPEVDLTGNVTLQAGGVLTLANGIFKPSNTIGTYTLTLNVGCTVSPVGGSALSYVDGPMQKVLAGGAENSFIFPTGNSGNWARVAVSNLSSATTFQAQYTKGIYQNTTVVQSMAASPTPVLARVSWLEYWQLTRAAGSGSANVTLYYENSTNSGINNCSDLKVAHYNGTSWENIDGTNTPTVTNCTGTTPGTTGNITTALLVSSFSPFTFGSLSIDLGTNPLPVTWLSFEPTLKTNNLVDVKWSTATETNNNYFSVMRSQDGINFKEVYREYAPGNSIVTQNYLYTDEVPAKGLWYYQIKQFDKNGVSSSTDVKSVQVISGPNVKFYPNPAYDKLTIDNIPDEWKNAKIQIYDAQGNIKKEINPDGSNTTSSIQLFVTDFTPGIYFLKITDASTGTLLSTHSFIKS